MYDDDLGFKQEMEPKRGLAALRWAAVMMVAVVVAVVAIIGFSLWALADTARIDFPDGSKDCTFQALTVSPSNTTLTVFGCYLGGPTSHPPPPPVSGDPGSGIWVTPTGVTVFDLSPSSNRNFIPGCIDGRNWQQTNCEYDGSLKAGKIYAARIRVSRDGGLNLKFDRAETGEVDGGSGVRGALSSIPGDTQTGTPACLFGEIDPYITVADQVRAASLAANDFCALLPPELRGGCQPIEPPCVAAADAVYYLNFTPTLPSCGNGAECRVQLIAN